MKTTDKSRVEQGQWDHSVEFAKELIDSIIKTSWDTDKIEVKPTQWITDDENKTSVKRRRLVKSNARPTLVREQADMELYFKNKVKENTAERRA